MAETDYLLELVASGDVIDLGLDHKAKFTQHKDVPRAGLLIVHPAGGNNHVPAGEPCCGAVNFDLPVNEGQTVWQLHSLEPLHIEPSVLCNCGDHGFIRDGRWVSV